MIEAAFIVFVGLLEEFHDRVNLALRSAARGDRTHAGELAETLDGLAWRLSASAGWYAYQNSGPDGELIAYDADDACMSTLGLVCAVSGLFGLTCTAIDDDDHAVAASCDDLFTNPELDSVANRLKDAVLYQRFVAVVGHVGSGKTLLKLRVAH